jgi:O-antigen/teichoic acid export membrane protein
MAALGAYGLAQRFAYMPVEVMTESLSSVLYPTYSKLDQERPERLGEVFRLMFLSSAAALTMLTAPMALGARGIIEFLYGKRWDAAVPVLAVMVYAGLFRGLARTLGPLMLAMHRPGVESKSKFAEGVVFITAALYLVPRGGAAGVAWAGVLSYALAFILRYWVALVLFPEQRRNLVQDVVQVTLVAILAYGIAYEAARLSWIAGVLSFEAAFLGLGCLSMPVLRQQVVNVWGLIFHRSALSAPGATT